MEIYKYRWYWIDNDSDIPVRIRQAQIVEYLMRSFVPRIAPSLLRTTLAGPVSGPYTFRRLSARKSPTSIDTRMGAFGMLPSMSKYLGLVVTGNPSRSLNTPCSVVNLNWWSGDFGMVFQTSPSLNRWMSWGVVFTTVFQKDIDSLIFVLRGCFLRVCMIDDVQRQGNQKKCSHLFVCKQNITYCTLHISDTFLFIQRMLLLVVLSAILLQHNRGIEASELHQKEKQSTLSSHTNKYTTSVPLCETMSNFKMYTIQYIIKMTKNTLFPFIRLWLINPVDTQKLKCVFRKHNLLQSYTN